MHIYIYTYIFIHTYLYIYIHTDSIVPNYLTPSNATELSPDFISPALTRLYLSKLSYAITHHLSLTPLHPTLLPSQAKEILNK